jgi:hypothetical protein
MLTCENNDFAIQALQPGWIWLEASHSQLPALS